MGYPDRVTVCVSLAVRLRDGMHVLRDRRDGPAEQPHVRRDRCAGRCWAKREAAKLPDTYRRGASRTSCSWGWGACERAPRVRLARPAPARRHRRRHLTVSTVGIVPGIERLADAHRRSARGDASTPRRRAAQRAGAAEQALPPGEARGRHRRLARETRRRPSIEWAMIGRRTTRRAGAGARADREAAGRPREPDPAEPHARFAGAAQLAAPDPRLRARAEGGGRERHGARHARPADRRRTAASCGWSTTTHPRT